MIDPHLKQSLELLGLPCIVPEPEVIAADLKRIQCKGLAQYIAELLMDDPLLRVEQDGPTVVVREIGGGAMTFTVEAA